ncbi:DnaJ C-terminal domain-containing protein [Legionella sp. CNM-4043-24]|uniref:DnaJ C-terminal domain-containing protein n=1 Tax=Legionella sp. CNM-4043-24 TaxID=3421646 RepID=UPI00403B078C
MEYKDYYKVMGLERNADQDEIKRTYRKLARKYHPDVSKEADAENKFKELGEAYEVLRDPEKRAKYDQFGQYWQHPEQQYQQQASSGHQYHQYSNDAEQAAAFEDFINQTFRQRYRQDNAAFYDKGQDIHARLSISLEDSFHGAEKSLQLQIPEVDAYGQVNYALRTIKVKIPKGIGDTQQIRLKGQGNKGSGNQPGDLYIEINILPHPMFRLDKKDVWLDLPISPWEATLGSTVEVPTLAGPVKLKIPRLSQSGSHMRLKGKGLPGTPHGDQMITLQIVIPKTENEEVNRLYEKMAEIAHFNPREKLGVRNDR